MKKLLLAALAAATFAVTIPVTTQSADAQTVVQERTVVRGDQGMHRGRYMHRDRYMHRGPRCFKERTRIYRNGRQVTIVKRVCR
jgi:Ni/Co efflux regulator RcnB